MSNVIIDKFDNRSYAYQCWLIFVAISPLLALGKCYSELLEVCASVAESIVSVALIIAFFSKSKECPRPVRVAVMDFISIYLWLLLPSAILIVNGYDDWMLLGIGIVFGVVAIITNFIYEKVKEDAEANIESMQVLRAEAGDSKEELVEMLFRDRWRVVNKLCDIYYEKSDSTGSLKFIVRDIEAELEGLRTQEGIEDILATADRCLDGVISRLREECGAFLKEQDIEFIGLIYAGLSVRAVCYMTGLRKANFYQKKNRLMRRIEESDARSREEFVEGLRGFRK